MGTERLYYGDPYTTRFRARVEAVEPRPEGIGVELNRTCFYPEGGGQTSDRGTLDGRRVVDVRVAEDGRIWHLVEGAGSPSGEIEAEVDWPRRFDAMQQHSGQHVLSAAFERIADAPTLSSTLGVERSVIEVELADADWPLVLRVEEAANRVVWEDRPVRLHWIDEEGARRFVLRKAPAVSGPIRVVEVPEWDASACGGTHVRRTGEIGCIKVLRWEKVRGHERFEFLCGARAWRDHAWRVEEMVEAARRRTLKDRELIAQLERAALERDELRKRMAGLTGRLIEAEARERAGDPPRGVAVFDASRPRGEARMLALKSLEAGAPWVVVGAAAPDPVVIAGRARGSRGERPGDARDSGERTRGVAEPDLRALLPGLIERAEGKGGGSADLIQVGASGPVKAEEAWRWACESLRRAMEAS